jgi:hypothetical protein
LSFINSSSAYLTLLKILVEFSFLISLILLFSSGIKQFVQKNVGGNKLYVQGSSLSPILVGPSVILLIYTTLHSLKISSSRATVIIFVLSFVILLGNIKEILVKKRNSLVFKNLVHGDIHLFLTSFLTTLLIFLQFNWISLTQGYRTGGNNDPYDYLILGRVFEASPLAYINFHSGWYDYADRLPWLTRFISFSQSVLPGGRYGDFLTFTFLSYFLVVFLTLQLLKTAKVNVFISICSTYFIFASSTLTYVFAQGFFLQIWGLGVLIGLMTLLIRLVFEPSKISPKEFSASFIFLGLLMILIYSPFFPFFIFLIACVLFPTFKRSTFGNLFQIKYATQRQKLSVLSCLKLRGHVLIISLVGILYFLFYLFPPIKIMAEFFFALRSGEYGWSRSTSDYLGPGLKGIFLPQGLILCLFALSLFRVFIKGSDQARRLLGFSVFGISISAGYFYFVIELGSNRYQTWKYFSFVFPLVILISLIIFSNIRGSRQLSHRREIKNGYKTLVFLLLPITLLIGAGANFSSHPSSVSLKLSNVNAIENLQEFSDKNVALAFEDIGSNMLIAGIIPAKSVSFFGPSYYGNLEAHKFSRIDFMLTTRERIARESVCAKVDVREIDDRIGMLPNSTYNLPCIIAISKMEK